MPKLPDVWEPMQTLGLDPVGGIPEEFAVFVKADIARWGKVAMKSGTRAE